MVRAASLRIGQSLPTESDLQNWFHATVTDYKRFAVPFNSSLSSLLLLRLRIKRSIRATAYSHQAPWGRKMNQCDPFNSAKLFPLERD
jgi:hypothetical protein